jgi:hypothetical protein
MFWKSVEKVKVLLKSDKDKGYFTWSTCHVFIISRSVLLRMRNRAEKAIEKIKTHILCSVTLYRKSCRLWDNVEKYCRAEQATDDSMAHVHCMLDNQGYKHKQRICNTHCFSTATVVARTRLSATLYVHHLSCYILKCFRFLSKFLFPEIVTSIMKHVSFSLSWITIYGLLLEIILLVFTCLYWFWFMLIPVFLVSYYILLLLSLLLLLLQLF